jgi:hypothetical protein
MLSPWLIRCDAMSADQLGHVSKLSADRTKDKSPKIAFILAVYFYRIIQ